jgi:hypothetical protein
MTTKTEALKLALDALGKAKRQIVHANIAPHGCIEDARAALRDALAQPEQEPVAWMHDAEGRVDVIHSAVKALWIKAGQPSGFYREKVPCKVEHYTIPLYTSPPKREWVGLTDDEYLNLQYLNGGFTPLKFAHAIEAKLKELNHD